jgi:transposase
MGNILEAACIGMRMRGRPDPQGAIFYAINLEELVPADHPLRSIRTMANEELKRLSSKFEAAYSHVGRPSIPSEQLIKASLLQALYSIRSERQLCEQLGYNLLFRWFVGLKPDERVWDSSTFTQNRRRFDEHGLMQAFFEGTVAAAIQKNAASCDHFSVNGTLIQAWASMKSVRPKEEPKDPSARPARQGVACRGRGSTGASNRDRPPRSAG